MSKIWFTSDLHFGHRLVSGLRGFDDDVHKHTEMVAENWSKLIRKDDVVWVLGDISMTNTTAREALEVIKLLPGTKHLIAGNHDGCHPMHRNSQTKQKLYFEAFDSVQMAGRQKWGGIEFMLSHFPYLRDRGETRHVQWRLRDEGAMLIHGHLHNNDRRIGREIHVGLDAWDLEPVSLEAVLSLAKEV